MAKNCYLIFSECGFLVCTTNHRKPELCDLHKADETEESYYKSENPDEE